MYPWNASIPFSITLQRFNIKCNVIVDSLVFNATESLDKKYIIVIIYSIIYALAKLHHRQSRTETVEQRLKISPEYHRFCYNCA